MEIPLKKRKTYSISFQPRIIMQSNIDICLQILDYLDNVELIKCKRVCTFWKEIVEKIMRKRIVIIFEKFPRSFLKEAILRPEFLLPYMKVEDQFNTQIIPEFIDESLSCKCTKLLNSSMSIGYNLGIERTGHKFRYSLRSTESIPFSKIAIFPSLSEIQINRFLFTKEDLREKLKERDIWSYSEIVNVPKEELKCILIFIDGHAYWEYMKIVPLCAMAGIGDMNKDSSEIKIIAFSGKILNAVSFLVSDQYLLRSYVREQFRKLKTCNINQNKCVAFIFGNVCECDITYTIRTFKKSFPRVPFLFYTSTQYFGVHYMGNLEENNILEFFNYYLSAILVLVWFN